MAKLILRSLRAIEPATGNGDDIEIFVNGISAGGQFGIDQGQSKDLTTLNPHEFDVDEGDMVNIAFTEDTDPAAEIDRPVAPGIHKERLKIKQDGDYEFFYSVRR
jgi:hypothetical protein